MRKRCRVRYYGSLQYQIDEHERTLRWMHGAPTQAECRDLIFERDAAQHTIPPTNACHSCQSDMWLLYTSYVPRFTSTGMLAVPVREFDVIERWDHRSNRGGAAMSTDFVVPAVNADLQAVVLISDRKKIVI